MANAIQRAYNWQPVSGLRDPSRENAVNAMLGQSPTAEYASVGGERVRGGGSMSGSALDLGYAGGGYGNMAYEALRDPSGNIIGQREYLDLYRKGLVPSLIEGMVIGGLGAAGAGIYGAAAGGGAAGGAAGAGGAAASGATNAALIDSALGTAGYGASSAGAGGGALASLGAVGGGTTGATGSAAGAAGGSGMGWADWAQLGVGLLGDAYQSNQIENASAAQQAATEGAIGEQRRQFDLTRGDLAPYREAAIPALQQYAELVNRPTTAADAMADPGYAWAQEQGQQALDRKFAASGGRLSGASLKAASRFNQGNATQYFGQADQRRENRLARLAALAQIGQSAVNTGTQSGMNMANQVGGYMQQQGDATGAAAIARGNVWGERANQIAALYGRKKADNSGGAYINPDYSWGP